MEDFSDKSAEEMDKQSSDYSSSDNEEKRAAREEQRIKEHRHNLARAMAKMEEKNKMRETAGSSKGFLKLKSKKAEEMRQS